MGIVLVLIYILLAIRGRPPLASSIASTRSGSFGLRALAAATSTLPSSFAPSFH